MSREINFRVWDTYNQRMVYYPFIFQPTQEHDNVSSPFTYYEDWRDFEDGIKRPCEVMQYIGLSDKNGKAIYECDIVETPSVKNMVIGWSEKFASFVIHRDGWAFQHFFGEAMNPEDCTVIGNVFETPELLKQ